MPIWLILYLVWCSGSATMGAILYFSDREFWRGALCAILAVFLAAAALGLLS